jgi:hypothetical protein
VLEGDLGHELPEEDEVCHLENGSRLSSNRGIAAEMQYID